ncbi:hypothetical protein JYP51_09450 [Ponticoccus gilvus]|nr:hypothetical protein [Enemella evansiae]
MKILMRPELSLFDVEGWRARLDDLSAESKNVAGHDIGLSYAEAIVGQLEEMAAQKAAEGR